MSGNDSLPIKMTSGRRLIIQQVTDTASFSARRLSFNAKELKVGSEWGVLAIVYQRRASEVVE